MLPEHLARIYLYYNLYLRESKYINFVPAKGFEPLYPFRRAVLQTAAIGLSAKLTF